jgi:hypothetical protein
MIGREQKWEARERTTSMIVVTAMIQDQGILKSISLHIKIGYTASQLVAV